MNKKKDILEKGKTLVKLPFQRLANFSTTGWIYGTWDD
jgi:hypothetical protein